MTVWLDLLWALIAGSVPFLVWGAVLTAVAVIAESEVEAGMAVIVTAMVAFLTGPAAVYVAVDLFRWAL